MAIEPVTHLEKSIAGTVDPVTHLEKVIAEYGKGGGGGEVTVDTELSPSSPNPVRNSAIYAALEDKATKTEIADFVTDDDVEEAIVDAIGDIVRFEYHVCGADEYDVTTGVPTVTNPDTNHIYLTPTSGTNLNMWAWIEGGFNFLGTTEVDLDGYAKTENLKDVAFSGDYADLDNTPTIPAAVTVDPSITQGSSNPVESSAIHAALALKANTADLADVAFSGDYGDLNNPPTIPPAVTVDSSITQGSSNPVESSAIHAALAQKANSSTVAAKANTADLAAVAFTGEYEDILHPPLIPTVPLNQVLGKIGGVNQALTINVIDSGEPGSGTLNSWITIVKG